jgi:DNA (cytosine-5)-methyltransferase 1
VFANEYDNHAARAFQANYPDIKMINRKIQDLTEDEINEMIGDQEVDIIIGGPPCQSFSTVGRRRFDDKARLYTEYLRMLRIIKPRMFLFENVKGMLSMREQVPIEDDNGNPILDEKGVQQTRPGALIMDIIKENFADLGEGLGYHLVGEKVLDAVNYGVPQHRERVFLVGVRNDILEQVDWHYPEPTHGGDENPYITISEAISDLPEISEGGRVDTYRNAPTNAYQTLMRGNNQVLTQHFCGKHNDKMRMVIAAVPQGEGRFYINKLVDNGELPESCRLTSGYANTYGRLVANKPCTTITNNMCTPSALRCIHYSQNRELTPREGARIQSFPDSYVFDGEKGHVTTQIGNAVPPLLAMAMARSIEEAGG